MPCPYKDLKMENEIKDRIRCPALRAKVATAEEAAGSIREGAAVALGSDALAICRALERRVQQGADLRLRLFSGVAILEADRLLGKTGAIGRRLGQQTLLRPAINAGRTDYLDLPLGFFYQSLRAGELGPLDVAVVEAVAVNGEGFLVPTHHMHDQASFVQLARKVIVQLNISYSLEVEGMHDVYLPPNPPRRGPIPIVRVDDRIGTPYIPVAREKIAFIVPAHEGPQGIPAAPIDPTSRRVARNLIAFLRQEVSRGNLPANLPPMEIGLGAIPAAVLEELGGAEFQDLEFYSAILNDGILKLIAQGKVRAASGTGFFLTPAGEQEFLCNLALYKKHIVLRPLEITDCPEVILRLGVLALNGAVEVDIYGHANSSHITHGAIISGVGGAGEFAMNARLSVLLLPSTAKGGDLSCIVPMVPHVDIPEHGVDVIVTEQGVADLRGLTPKERAQRIIQECAHPSYRPLLEDYFSRAVKDGGAHEPHLLREAFSFHLRFMETGSMKTP